MTKVSREYVMNGLKEILVDALGIDEDEIKEEARIGSDLGAESIDYLDITYRIEKEFKFKIPRGELFPEMGSGVSRPQESKHMNELARMSRSRDFGESGEGDSKDIRSEYTVRTLVNYIETKLNQ